jgi:peptidoglycan/xylan/chitin deacetylase (PgdA/CDA1 family)
MTTTQLPSLRRRRFESIRIGITGLALAFLATSCVAPGAVSEGRRSPQIGSNDDYTVILSVAGDTYESLASRHLGDRDSAWMLRQLNGSGDLEAGQVVIIPNRWPNPAGVTPGSYQIVPVLCYHDFSDNGLELSVKPEVFREQLSYLRDNGYRVVSLADLMSFLKDGEPLPPKAVVITIDDGYRSTYHVAFPILREFGFPATLFVYSDFLNKGGLTTKQMKEMLASSLIDIQPHSKSHRNMAALEAGEGIDDYMERIMAEVEVPHEALEELLDNEVYSFAFPYGATTTMVLDLVAENDYDIALTVERGGNAFFQNPYLLKRSMIYRDHDIERFKRELEVSVAY